MGEVCGDWTTIVVVALKTSHPTIFFTSFTYFQVIIQICVLRSYSSKSYFPFSVPLSNYRKLDEFGVSITFMP
jgi:hypothetical protein